MGLRLQVLALKVPGAGFRISDLAFRVSGLGCRVLSFGNQVSNSGFRSSGAGFCWASRPDAAGHVSVEFQRARYHGVLENAGDVAALHNLSIASPLIPNPHPENLDGNPKPQNPERQRCRVQDFGFRISGVGAEFMG